VGLAPNGGAPASGFGAFQSLTSNGEQFANPFEQWGLSGTVEWDLGFSELTYIASFRDFRAESIQESDFVGARVFSVGGSTAAPGTDPSFDDIQLTTHELRLQGQAFGGRLDWLVGAFYSEENIVEEATLTLGPDYQAYVSANLIPLVGTSLGPNPIRDVFAGGVDANGSFAYNRYTQDAESISVFTHNVIGLTDRLDVTLGLRYVEETKDGAFDQLAASSNACLSVLSRAPLFSGGPLASLVPLAVGLSCFPFATVADIPGAGTVGGPPTPATFADTFEDEELIYTLGARYEITPDINAYVTFTHGFKAGGFNLDSTAAVGGGDPRFDSELVDAYEFGLKSELFDGRVRANLAIFHQELENFQVLEFTGIQFVTFNVPTAQSTGAELEMQAFLTDSLGLNLALTYTDSRYPDDCAPASAPAQVRALCGQDLTNAPDFVGILGADFETPITDSGIRFFASGSVRYESDRRTSTQAVNVGTTIPLAYDIQDANTKVNLRMGLTAPDESWALEFWGNNIFDEQTRNVTFNVPLRGGSYLIPVFGPDANTARGVYIQDPATYGVTLRTRF
jgi:outer membrane receptor protein involved in Fe transport